MEEVQDLISRQETIKVIRDAMLAWSYMPQWREDKIIDAVKALPSSQQWVPCSKRLPTDPGLYQVTDHKGNVVRFDFNNSESSREYWQRCAKAWMHLPEPYKEEYK